MHSARNANRHGPSSNRARGGGGQPRGGMNTRNHNSQSPHSVPGTHQVIRGSPVSIVLKADQPTGHETLGIVAELLTRGNHPRGIKVRLQDGQVGRVQRMVTMEAVTAASADLDGMGRSERLADQTDEPVPFTKLHMPGSSTQSYNNHNSEILAGASGVGSILSDYVVVKTKGKKGKKTVEESDNQDSVDSVLGVPNASDSATSTCPVCKVFEGDEIAVAHHVNSHFE